MIRFFFRSRIAIALLLLVVLASSFAALISMKSGVKAATASIALDQQIGPPTTVIKVSGTGFGASESVNINFDTTFLHSVTTSTLGTFLLRVTVPSTAL